jgi:GDP-4-dehydro-6-deoxy-D-mannose reductase
MRILVTGADGFVGRHLLQLLVAQGETVVGLTGRAHELAGVEASFAVDLADKTALDKIDLGQTDAVVHLAGLAAVGPSFADPMRYITTNAAIEATLFEYFVTRGQTPRFIIISTGGLYDPASSLPITESASTIPSSPYAVSKLTQESLAKYYGLRGFEVIIARPFNHVGPGQGEGFLFPDLAKQITQLEKTAGHEIVVGNLEAKRDYTDVRDITRAYYALIQKGMPGRIYNICSGQSRSGNEILEAMMAVATLEKPHIKQQADRMRPSDTPEIYGDHTLITKDTGWMPEITFEQSIQDVLADWRSRTND